MSDNLMLSGFVDLALALGKPIVLFDLECTAFRGRPNFGITEACFLTAVPAKGAGGVVEYGSLVNPENRIDAKVVELTGITQEMVASAKPWNKSFMNHFAEWAPHAYFTGFNSDSFDLPAVQDQAKRYGAAVPEFPHHFDVRKLHLKLSESTSQKGKLLDVAAFYGVRPRGALHRAAADVALTAETLSVMVHAYGMDALLELIRTPGTATVVLTAQNVARYVSASRVRSVGEIATLFKVDESKASFEVGRAVDERLMDDPFVLSEPSAQQWLVPAVSALPTELTSAGRLKQIHEALQPQAPAGVNLDYVQLRLAMLTANLSWSTLRSARAS